jgi:hypothetical protein
MSFVLHCNFLSGLSYFSYSVYLRNIFSGLVFYKHLEPREISRPQESITEDEEEIVRKSTMG